MTNVLRVPVPQDLLAGSGRALGPTPWVTVTQHEVNQFAEATGDFQWIHTDAARAKDGPFGSTIAHGYLTLALAGRFVPQLIVVEKCSAIINYGCDRAASRQRFRCQAGSEAPERSPRPARSPAASK